MAIEKSFAPITCQIYSECGQSSLIKMSITGKEMVVQTWGCSDLGKKGKEDFLPYIFSAQNVQLPLIWSPLGYLVFSGSSGV